MNRHYEIAQYMLQQYIDTGKVLLISEIAKALKTSARTIHDVINADMGRNWDLTEVEVPAGQYSNFTGRMRVAPACMPTRRRLLEIIREQQQQLADANGLIAKLGHTVQQTV